MVVVGGSRSRIYRTLSTNPTEAGHDRCTDSARSTSGEPREGSPQGMTIPARIKEKRALRPRELPFERLRSFFGKYTPEDENTPTPRRYCTLAREVASRVHIFSFVHHSVNMNPFVRHHVDTLGVPLENLHVFVDGAGLDVPVRRLRCVSHPNITYSSDLKRDVVNAHVPHAQYTVWLRHIRVRACLPGGRRRALVPTKVQVDSVRMSEYGDATLLALGLARRCSCCENTWILVNV